MKTITLIPGSAEWLQSRSASKAPAMMGCDPNTSRSELVRMMATGLGKEFTDWQQKNLLDKGHVSEIGARDIAEDILCDGLSPICCATDNDYLTAAPDGATFSGNIGFEAKAWNEKTAAFVRDGIVPDYHAWQLDQQILVCGFEYVLFMVTDGTREKCVSTEYRTTPERAKKLMAGWKQFDLDLAAYQHVDAVPVAIAEPIKDLPAIVVRVSGALTIETNFATWGVELKSFIDRLPERVPEKLSTDQEFADCKAAIAAFKKAEAQLDAEENRVLSSVPDVDEMKRVKKLLRDMSSTTRLILEKRAVSRDQQVKIEIMQEGKDALAAHLSGLNKRLATVQMPAIVADFAAAIKGKKLYSSMREAVAALLAQKKIESNALADAIQINLSTLDKAKEYAFLFSDRAAIVMKAPDDLSLLIKSRIADHKAAEAKREEETRQRIRAEEEARAAAKVKAEQDEAERQRRVGEAAAAKIEADRIAAQTAKQMRELDAAEDAAIVAKTPEPATIFPGRENRSTEPATPSATVAPTAAEVGGYTAASPVAEADWPVMRLRLDNLAVRMSASQLYELCIHAVRILESRKGAA